jgi:hypothetical protein
MRPAATRPEVITDMRALALAALGAAILSLSATPAHAYLDPGSGSMLLQLLLGGAAGLAVIVKLYWRRFKAFLGVGGAEKGGS